MDDTTRSDGGAGTARVAREQASAVASTTAGETAQVAGAAVETTKQVAATATQSASEVAGAAVQQASQVVDEAKAQARNLVDEGRTQLRSQAEQQTEALASQLRRIGDQVRALAEGRADDAGPLGDYARQAAATVTDVAGRIEQRGLDGVVQDVTRLARRRPGAFLLGAAAAGFGIGRLLRQAGGETPDTRDAQQELGVMAGHAPMGAPDATTELPLSSAAPVLDMTDGAMQMPTDTDPEVPAGLTATGEPMTASIPGAGTGPR